MSEKFDRSRFKGAKASANKEVVDTASEQTSFGGGRKGYHKIGEGKTILRIAPPHNEDSPSLQPVCKAWLPQIVEDKDGKKVKKNMPTFNARVHSPLKKDVVDEYVSYLSKKMYKLHSKEEAKKKLGAVNGFRDGTGKWTSGIRPTLGFVAYAWKGDELARAELNKTVVDRMNELSIDEESDETISVDPFSDPDTGVSLILEYDKSADAKKKWLVNAGKSPKPLTDAQLMELDGVESLVELFSNAYTKEDFSRSLEGLSLFDSENKYGVMQEEEFIQICEEISQMIDDCPDIAESNRSHDDDEDGEESAPKAPVKSAPTINKKEPEDKPFLIHDDGAESDEANDDGLADLDMDELKEYIASYNLPVVVKPAHTKAAVIKQIRAAVSAASAPQSESVSTGSEAWKALEDESAPFKAPDAPSDTTDRLAAMRARMAKK